MNAIRHSIQKYASKNMIKKLPETTDFGWFFLDAIRNGLISNYLIPDRNLRRWIRLWPNRRFKTPIRRIFRLCFRRSHWHGYWDGSWIKNLESKIWDLGEEKLQLFSVSSFWSWFVFLMRKAWDYHNYFPKLLYTLRVKAKRWELSDREKMWP